MEDTFSPTKYKLQSLATGNIFEDSGWMLDAPGEDMSALIRAIYDSKQIHLRDKSLGFYQFADWLPISRMLKGSSAPVTYKSEGLARVLGLSNLWITFSGYWPEKGANMTTCSFKETEAYSVCGRLNPGQKKVLVVASAGNTARAFAKVCSDNHIPLLLCVPHDYINALWFDAPLNDCVKLAVTAYGSDYFDAIYLSNLATQCDGYLAEGGAKNVARRDGMGTTTLSAVTTIGRIPEYYFQAVGSGTGAIAAWEANLRLIEDGRFGSNKMKLMVSQNSPFLPIYEAWKAGSRAMLPYDDILAREHVTEIEAKVLSNRKPPYPIIGGLYDAMCDAGGDVLKATNLEARGAKEIFLETEGVDIYAASAVATASLYNAVHEGLVEKDALIMLNITGGGEELFKSKHSLHYLEPTLKFGVTPTLDQVQKALTGLVW
ncbi:MAG: cysteate synthase [Bacteroidetes bacterium HGW-Bacteroidetes-9]|jgi:cysteate synthase|nr:MAG: cysteate synthase [Bacteroidetes bacterium HGW-Bacteroidetes-9]